MGSSFTIHNDFISHPAVWEYVGDVYCVDYDPTVVLETQTLGDCQSQCVAFNAGDWDQDFQWECSYVRYSDKSNRCEVYGKHQNCNEQYTDMKYLIEDKVFYEPYNNYHDPNLDDGEFREAIHVKSAEACADACWDRIWCTDFVWGRDPRKHYFEWCFFIAHSQSYVKHARRLDVTSGSVNDRLTMYRQQRLEGVNVWVKCGAAGGIAWSSALAALAIIGAIVAGVGSFGTAVGPAAALALTVTSVAIGGVADAAAYGGEMYDTLMASHDGPAAMHTLANALDGEYQLLKPGMTSDAHWGSLSLLQECNVVYPDGKHTTQYVWTAWCADCNRPYYVTSHFGSEGRRRADELPGIDADDSAAVPSFLTQIEDEEIPVVDYLVGAWDGIDQCKETSEHCNTCLPCLECFEETDVEKLTNPSEKCKKCGEECTDCAQDVPCILHDSLDDCRFDRVENEAEVPLCFEHCHACTTSSSFCEECSACEDTLRSAGRCLVRESRLKDPERSVEKDMAKETKKGKKGPWKKFVKGDKNQRAAKVEKADKADKPKKVGKLGKLGKRGKARKDGKN